MITSTAYTFCIPKSCKIINARLQKAILTASTQSWVRYLTTEKLKETDLVVREKIQLSRPSITKWKRPPFVKNLFIGKFDTELLAFPEILDNEHLAALERSVLAINELYKEKVNSLKIDEDRNIPEDVLQELREMGLFSRLAPAKYGGLELTHTEYARMNEAIGLDWSIGALLSMHELVGIQALLVCGTEAQKEKYLPDLVSGKKIATICSYESISGSDPLSIEMTATPSIDGTSYCLTGTKTWVTNAAGADLYLVLAKHPKKVAMEDPEITMFLVDKDSEGVTVSPIFDNVSLCGTGVGSVQFDEVIVPSSNVLGRTGIGYVILNQLYEMVRFGVGSLTIGALKTFLDHVTEHTVHAERNGKSLADFVLVRERLARIAEKLYVMESLVYFTAALYDSTENPDCTIENAILKLYNSEGSLFCLQELMKVVGIVGLSKGQQLERFYRDAQALARFETSNDIVRLFIGLNGCKVHGDHNSDEIEKYRNPFFFPWDKVKLLNRYRRISKGKFDYNQDLAGHLHPSLVPQGNYLEECVQMLDASVNHVLQLHGRKVVETQFDPIRLANMVTEIYAMTAVLSRISRSYCIGLRNCDHEIKIAFGFCDEAKKRVRKLFDEILEGVTLNNDAVYLTIGEQVVDCKGYFPEHPLKHNF